MGQRALEVYLNGLHKAHDDIVLAIHVLPFTSVLERYVGNEILLNLPLEIDELMEVVAVGDVARGHDDGLGEVVLQLLDHKLFGVEELVQQQEHLA